MTIRLAAILAACLAVLTTLATPAALAQDQSATSEETPRFMYAKMTTSKGDIVIQLDSKHAPISAENFATYVKDGFYDNTIFHRVMPTFVIQGGGFEPGLNQKPTRRPIVNEWRNGLKNDRGTLSMARTNDPNSATSQFFINLVDNSALDSARPQTGNAAYAVFGQVVEGMDVVDAIAAVKTGPAPSNPRMTDVPTTDVLITKAVMIEESDIDPTALAEAMARTKKYDDRIEAEKLALEERARKAQEGAMAKVKELGGDPENMTRTDSGLLYYDLEEGTGEQPPTRSTEVTVHYTGWLTDGTKFDSSVDKGRPYTLALNRFVPGFSEGVSGMKVGGKRILVIPYQIAYGDSGSRTIPPRSNLVFEVELLEFAK